MQKFYTLITSLAFLLILGAGCANTTTEQTRAPKVKPLQKTTMPTTTPSDGDIELTASSMGPNMVNFEWNISKQIEDIAEGWRIVYGEDENPTYPSTWWFERGASFREKLWKGLPAGNAHFRVCALVDDECDVYSNDVFVTIEGEIELSAQKLCEQTEGSVWDEEAETCMEDPETMISDEEKEMMDNTDK